MTRYRRRGGFRCLMHLAGVMSLARLVVLALGLIFFFGPGSTLPCILCLLFSLALVPGVRRLIRVYDLADPSGLILDAAADAATGAFIAVTLALRFASLRIPACILLVLSILGLTRKLCGMKHAAV